MLPIRIAVRVSLALLRVATQAALFLEAQRVLLRILRPVPPDYLCRAESRVLSAVHVKLEDIFIRDVDSNKIHIIHAANPNPNAPPIVLLHGHSMSAAFWCRNFDDLVALGYRVYAIDLLGWGRSERPLFRGHSPDESIRWFLRSLTAVLNSLNLTQFTLVGHSLGAYLSMEYAKVHPERVQQLVLVSPAASVRPLSMMRAFYFCLPPQNIVRRGGLLGFLLFTLKYPRSETYVRDRLRDYTYQLAAQYPPSGENAIRPIIEIRGLQRAECVRPMIEHLSLLHMHVHIICGEFDSSMPVEGVFELYEEMKIKGFNVEMTVVEGSDHCPMLEKPEDFSNIMMAIKKKAQRNFYGSSDSPLCSKPS